MKTVTGLVIVLLSTVLGSLYASKFKKKRDYFVSLENFAVYLKREISFSASPLKTVVGSFRTDNEELAPLLNSVTEGEAVFPEYITEDERGIIGRFFEKLGKSDRTNEIELTSAFVEEIKRKKEEESGRYKRVAALSVKLGFFFGLAVFIILL